ncbi:serine threonine- kinase STY46 [Olea europaea subsp. europaea]|uniref:Serine threonine- kinase STY46 n=1 Tax=Olea europaea subsp. europaea TaxID=158383 RepID=A0A8S0Q3T1_OLEEU|nr:serine threonine- kinase STY46 [Olea europaea subsp. europaea]
MYNNYRDNWERLVKAVFDREKLKQLALAHSRESSISSMSWEDSPIHDRILQLEGFRSPNTVNEQDWERLLPSDYENIISRSVNRVDYASKKELYLSLCESPILLDGGKMNFMHNYFFAFLLSFPGVLQDQNGSHFEPRPVPPPLRNKCDWEIAPVELDFTSATIIGKGDLHQYLKEKGALNPSTAISFAMDIARGMAYLHREPNVIIHRDLKPRNVLLVNSKADHLKVGDFGSSKLITGQNSYDVYKMTGETGSYRYMAPEVFKHQKYDKKVDVFSFAMILYEMLEGEPPMAHYDPYEVARYVAEGHRPMFRAKGFIPDLRELSDMCWAADTDQRPSFLEILRRLENIKDTLPSGRKWWISRRSKR